MADATTNDLNIFRYAFLHFPQFLHQTCIVGLKMLMHAGREKCCELFNIISGKFLYKVISHIKLSLIPGCTLDSSGELNKMKETSLFPLGSISRDSYLVGIGWAIHWHF